MPKAKLPQPYALRIEMIRAKGYPDHEVLALISRNDADLLKERIDPEANWDGFVAYAAENADSVKAAVTEGYQFTFITIGGIKNLLSIRFHKTEGPDYAFDGSSIDRLQMGAAEFQALRELVPGHWKMTAATAGADAYSVQIRIELAIIE